ncbi:MAG TPA: DUF2889 domain-containing protein [Gaiellaceae bacterium]|nr:DUF2889 domain-containing protein [Gaiellaceae bacterium]
MEGTGMSDLDELDPPPDDSVVGTPARRPGSVRRTGSILMSWPDGVVGALRLHGQARDLLTRDDGTPEVLAEAEMTAVVARNRTIEAIRARPEHPTIERLVGAQGGSNLRTAIDQAVPGEREAGTPLHFLLDDIAGTSLISGLALMQAAIKGGPEAREQMAMRERPVQTDGLGMRKGRIICSGLRPGGYAQRGRERGDFGGTFLRLAGDLSTDDELGWHDMEPLAGIAMRRRRRLDAWRDGDAIGVDVHFRDSVWDPDGFELVVHEYTVQATIDLATGALRDVDAVPRVLPFPECPWAAPHAAQLVGLDVGGFRTNVQQTLTEVECCTHLNDMLRGLTEVPRFAAPVLA